MRLANNAIRLTLIASAILVAWPALLAFRGMSFLETSGSADEFTWLFGSAWAVIMASGVLATMAWVLVLFEALV